MKTKITKITAFMVVAITIVAVDVQAQTNTFPSTGSVGIGTTTPSVKLDVQGIGGIANAAGLNLDSNGTGTSAFFQKFANSGKLIVGWNRSAGGQEIDLISNRKGGLGGFMFSDLDNSGNVKKLMSIDGTTGNVSMISQLTTDGDLITKNNLIAGGSNSWMFHSPDDGRTSLYIGPGSNGGSWNWAAGTEFKNNGEVVHSSNLYVNGNLTMGSNKQINSPGRLHITGQEALYLLNKNGVIISKSWGGNGNLTVEGSVGLVAGGVLKTSFANNGDGFFSGKLQVDGTILTTRVKVAAFGSNYWADYVFAKEYQLKPLHQVEAYIKANQHLEGIPTTEEIHRDGLDVAPVTAKLLEKIEELTLYVIEIKKENNLQQKQIELQQQQIKDLQQPVNENNNLKK